MVQSSWRGSLLKHYTLLQAATWASIIWALVAVSATPFSISMWFPLVQSWSFSQWPLTSVCLSVRWHLSVPPKLCLIIQGTLDVHLGFSFPIGKTEMPGDPLGTALCPLYGGANAVKVNCSSYPYNTSWFLWFQGCFSLPLRFRDFSQWFLIYELVLTRVRRTEVKNYLCCHLDDVITVNTFYKADY